MFQPIAGRAEEILDYLIRTDELLAYPSLAYPLRLSCEEIIVNIISYAYPVDTNGYIWLEVTANQDELCIEIHDGGVPFNPIEKQEPDLTQELEEREIGGLGIYLVLRMMDKVEYKREKGENKLILKKKINHENDDG